MFISIFTTVAVGRHAGPMMHSSLLRHLHDSVHITSSFGWLLKTFF